MLINWRRRRRRSRMVKRRKRIAATSDISAQLETSG
jgi:hypothetical protein